MKKKVLSYVALSSALLTAAPLLGNVTANAATTNNTISSSAKVSSSSSSFKESSKVSASVKSSSATSSSKTADKKAARSAVRANNFAESTLPDGWTSGPRAGLIQRPMTYQNVKRMINSWGDKTLSNDVINSFNSNSTIVPNVTSKGFEEVTGSQGGVDGLYYNGQSFTGFDVQDGVFWYKGLPCTLATLEKAGIKVPQNIVNAMKEAAAKANNGTARLANGQTIRTYGYNHYVANVNARTLPKTGESNSIVSLLKALF